MSNIGIIGSGVIGLSSAYYLQKSGHQVTLFDQSDLKDGCSVGNAGMIVPSHLIPLAAPGMIAKGIRWMFNSSSPFFVRPRWDTDLFKWGFQFYKSATKAHVEKSAITLKEISLLSKAMYEQLTNELPVDFGYCERGLLMLYKTKETEHEERETAELANRHGVEARILSAEEVQQLEPDVKVDVHGAVYFPGDAHLTPQELVNQLIQHLRINHAIFHTNTEIINFEIVSEKIKSVVTNQGNFAFDEIVIAAGSWSGAIAKKLNLNLPMQAGKGYSFTLPEVEKNVRIPSIFLEARVAVTPMGSSLRFGGTMEITGLDHSIDMKRVKGIVDSIPLYYPEIKVGMPLKETVWHGLRPCSPDGLPYIGRTKKYKNLILATGHSMLGVSLGPGTGKLVSEIVKNEKPSIRLRMFDPERFA
jgi:D-amino-acid dehydrogenase